MSTEHIENLLASQQQGHSQHHKYWKGGFDPEQVDTKRHYSMHSTCLPIVKSLAPETLLTIGDHTGRDAAYYKRYVGCKSTASSLSVDHLQQAVIDGFLDDAVVVNAEKIDLPDDSIDVVVIKESFHHFPRPMVGFYECLRVAKKAVILIEPNDCKNNGTNTQTFYKDKDYSDAYEAAGNYKYQISLREICKAMWAIKYPQVVVTGFNDPYGHADYQNEKDKLNVMGFASTRCFNLLTIACIKEKTNLEETLDTSVYTIYNRPIDPYEK